MPLLAGAALMAANDHTVSTITAVILAVVGLAILALIVSNSAKSAGVITSGGTSLAQVICTALSPVMHGGDCLTPSVTSRVIF